MKSLLEAGAAVQRAFERNEWRFCFIGGVANFRWGTPRLTNDLDLTLMTGFGSEPAYVQSLVTEFESRIADAASFAVAHRVVLLRTVDGFGVDVALGALPFEDRTIERSSLAELQPGAVLRTCSAEDLVVHKSFASRSQDWVDIEGVLIKQEGKLEWPEIWAELSELAALKQDATIVDMLYRTIEKAEAVVGPFDHES